MHHLDVLSIDGTMSSKKRDEVLRHFKKGGPNVPRVLTISSIGAVGLNIAEANILIILVRAF